MVKGLPTFQKENEKFQACIYGKQIRLAFPTSTWRETRRLQLVQSDICGPLDTSLRECKYFLLFIDEFNKIVWECFLKEKSEAFTHFQSFQNLVETATGEKIATLRTDNGR